MVIKQTVEAVKTQQETKTNIAIEDDLTDAVASIIVSTDNDTASKLIEEVSKIAKALTPVPGGVGPMTIACLLKNTIECFKRSLNN